MTRAYVLDPVTRATLGLVDQSWERLSYTRRYVAMDTFELAINRTRLWASELQTNRLLYLPDEGDLIFLIEQIASVAEGSTRNDQMTVSGRSLEGIAMAERLVEPPTGQSHDRQTAVAAETAMKHYLRAHAADLAAPARGVPGLVAAPDGVRGPAVTVAGRYQTVFDLVREIGLLAGFGWQITYDPAGDAFVFDIIDGVDRSASVFFDFAFETLERTEELDSVLDSTTLAVVAGQGAGAARDIVTRWSGSEPVGFARREAFLDARDVELGATTVLAQRGDAFLEAAASETRLEAGIHQYGAFRYGQHWDLGDLVLVRHAERGLAYAARVVEVEVVFERSAAAPAVTAVIDRPFPTMRERVEGSGAHGGAVDYPVGAAPSGPAGGELAGTYPAPTVSATHGGSAHHARAHDHAAAADGTALAPATVAIASTGTDALTIGADVNLYRAAANTLATDDKFRVGNPETAGGSGVFLRPEGSLEIVANAGVPYIDLKSDASVDHHMRLIMATTTLLELQGGKLKLTHSGGRDTLALSSAGTDTGITIGGDTQLYRAAAGDLRLAASGNSFLRALAGSSAAHYGGLLVQKDGDTAARGIYGWAGDEGKLGLFLGGGAGGRDTNLYRAAAGVLRTDGELRAGNVRAGTVSITPVANSNTGVTVTYGEAMVAGTELACATTANSTATAVTETYYSSLGTTSVIVRILRSNTTTTGVSWIVWGGQD